MPNFDFRCKKCEFAYEEIAKFDPTGKYKGVKCPKCKSSSKERLISSCGYAFSDPVGTDRWNSAEYCHDYRYKHAQPGVAAERAAAEAHLNGEQPYEEIDDISSGKYFGEVK